jgi:hypothetical protein
MLITVLPRRASIEQCTKDLVAETEGKLAGIHVSGDHQREAPGCRVSHILEEGTAEYRQLGG